MMKFASLLFVLFIAACGFQPVYGDYGQDDAFSSVGSELNSISVDIIPDREGQMLRNALIDRLYKNGYPANPQFSLSVSPVEESIVEIGVDKDDNASRAQLRLSTTFRLISTNNNKVVLTRTVRATTGYNILAGQFTTYVTEDDARKQGIQNLGANIMTQLELYFSR